MNAETTSDAVMTEPSAETLETDTSSLPSRDWEDFDDGSDSWDNDSEDGQSLTNPPLWRSANPQIAHLFCPGRRSMDDEDFQRCGWLEIGVPEFLETKTWSLGSTALVALGVYNTYDRINMSENPNRFEQWDAGFFATNGCFQCEKNHCYARKYLKSPESFARVYSSENDCFLIHKTLLRRDSILLSEMDIRNSEFRDLDNESPLELAFSSENTSTIQLYIESISAPCDLQLRTSIWNPMSRIHSEYADVEVTTSCLVTIYCNTYLLAYRLRSRPLLMYHLTEMFRKCFESHGSTIGFSDGTQQRYPEFLKADTVKKLYDTLPEASSSMSMSELTAYRINDMRGIIAHVLSQVLHHGRPCFSRKNTVKTIRVLANQCPQFARDLAWMADKC
ncbi:hypothetical protein BJ508DRAFT_164743 [Ascobolus immersus RN42]|uniref:Uncharacterized protein n=1 Tax=Ascobolus immersus RN42 TaxID=1160509 RepID=A0A3N4HVH5_ASCIM|nr:hypothetical protein BJ508DRAFT_164743 [Ascobolus immersus RN42]